MMSDVATTGPAAPTATRRIAPLVLVMATVLLGYVFGHSFWHVRLGPLPITFDRLLLAVLLPVAGWYAWQQRRAWRAPLLVDWILLALLAWLTLSTLVGNMAGDARLPTSPYFRLLFSFWIPAVLYLSVRLVPLSTRTVTTVLALTTCLGVYLAATACAEVAGLWWAVLPSYIGDPELGTHFGRARGPALNSVSLGIYLSVAFWAAWTLRCRVARGWQLLLLLAMGFMAVAAVLTMTRSVWLGLALSGWVMLVAETPRRLRLPVAAGSLAVGALLAIAGWSFVMQLDREDSGNVSQHSVQQRTAFHYVSWKMFCDHPLAGVGFGRFYDRKLPYLADRSQPFELESLRPLHHHSTFLGLLVETGLAGVAGYLAVLGAWGAIGYRMAFTADASLATRQMGRLLLAVLAVYLPSAVFHDLSHIFQDQWLVFVFAGLSVGVAEQFARRPLAERHPAPAGLPRYPAYASPFPRR